MREQKRGDGMSIEQEKMIVESLPSLYPLQEFEEEAQEQKANAHLIYIRCTKEHSTAD